MEGMLRELERRRELVMIPVRETTKNGSSMHRPKGLTRPDPAS